MRPVQQERHHQALSQPSLRPDQSPSQIHRQKERHTWPVVLRQPEQGPEQRLVLVPLLRQELSGRPQDADPRRQGLPDVGTTPTASVRPPAKVGSGRSGGRPSVGVLPAYAGAGQLIGTLHPASFHPPLTASGIEQSLGGDQGKRSSRARTILTLTDRRRSQRSTPRAPPPPFPW